MEYPAARKISDAPSARNLKRGDVFAHREWPPGCGPFSPPSAPSDGIVNYEFEKPKPNSSLSDNEKEIPTSLETRTTKNSQLVLRKTARKSVKAPSNRLLAERKSNKKAKLVEQRIPSSTALIVSKEGIPNPLFLNRDIRLSDARSQIKAILTLFQKVCRKLIQTDPVVRFHAKAARIVKGSELYNNLESAILGPVPGVNVGDTFLYMTEINLIGLHRPLQGGIDWTDFNGVRVATSIVSSGGYSDELCSYEKKLIFIGSGGKPTGKKGQKTKPEDQKLEKGNMALVNSFRLKTPVRVIHRLNTSATSKPVMTFFYDGLYMVESYDYVDHSYKIDDRNFKTKVYKFILKRNGGQAETGFNVVAKLNKSRAREGLCIGDISKRKEKIPVCAINTIDDQKPPNFMYITNNVYPSSYEKTVPKGCECIGNCIGLKCACAAKNGGAIPFISNDKIVEKKNVVYECGPSCECPPSCPNRVTQNKITYRLEIFKKAGREWGVRSLELISHGSFICEYVGEVMVVEEDNVVCIDAGVRGNVARFLKRSPYPNLMAQKVLFDHDDERMAHVMFFASENIPPYQELTY